MLRTQKKKLRQAQKFSHHLRGGERGVEGGVERGVERGVEGVVNGRCSVLNARNTRTQRKPDINLTTLQPRRNTTVAMCYAPVIMHIRGCYANLQYYVTVVTSSYTCDIPSERNNELINTRKLYTTNLYIRNLLLHKKSWFNN